MMYKLKQHLRFYVLPFFLWPVFIVFFIVLLPVCIVIFVVRSTEYVIYRTLYSAHLFPFDDIVWTMKSRANQLCINCCLIVDGVLPIHDFRKLIDETLVQFQDANEDFLYWKATKRILPGFLNYYWVHDEHFDLSNHVYELLSRVVTCSDELRLLLSEHRSKELVPKDGVGSPWEFVLIPYEEEAGCRKTVIFCRLSHAIADGTALAYFLINRLGQYRQEYKDKDVLKFSQISRKFSKIDRCLMNLKGIWVLPVVQSELLLSFGDSNVLHTSNATGTKSITWSNPIDLAAVKGIKNTLNCTVNDVLLGCLTKTLNEYFNDVDAICPTEISVIFPFDLRSSPDDAKGFNNKLAAMVIRLSTSESNLITSIQDTRSRMNTIKHSGDPIGSSVGWKFLSFLLPRFISKFFIFTIINKTTGSISNLMGPQQAISIGDCAVDAVVFWPPQASHQSFGVAFCSYNGSIVMGVESDHAVLKDPGIIVNMFEKNIKSLQCEQANVDTVVDLATDKENMEHLECSSKDNRAFESVIGIVDPAPPHQKMDNPAKEWPIPQGNPKDFDVNP